MFSEALALLDRNTVLNMQEDMREEMQELRNKYRKSQAIIQQLETDRKKNVAALVQKDETIAQKDKTIAQRDESLLR